jgi:hypothetical protein
MSRLMKVRGRRFPTHSPRGHHLEAAPRFPRGRHLDRNFEYPADSSFNAHFHTGPGEYLLYKGKMEVRGGSERGGDTAIAPGYESSGSRHVPHQPHRGRTPCRCRLSSRPSRVRPGRTRKPASASRLQTLTLVGGQLVTPTVTSFMRAGGERTKQVGQQQCG